MSAAAIAERRVDLLDAFKERADARAYLWAIGEYELAEAVDVLQHDAERDGLLDRIGQDAVQAILTDAFQPWRYWVLGSSRTNLQPDINTAERSRYETPQTTVEAIMYCVRERGLGALNEAANVERLSRCDPAAGAQINKRIATLVEKGTVL